MVAVRWMDAEIQKRSITMTKAAIANRLAAKGANPSTVKGWMENRHKPQGMTLKLVLTELDAIAESQRANVKKSPLNAKNLKGLRFS